MNYFVKEFDSREVAMTAQREKGFPTLALYNGSYYHFGLDAEDAFYSDMTLLDVDESNLILVTERPDHFKLARYVTTLNEDPCIPPLDVDYIRLANKRLHKVLTYNDDFRVVKKEFFAEGALDSLGEVVGDDLVIDEVFVYTVDEEGFARHRTQVIRYYLEDGTIGYSSELREKYYNNVESREEGRQRRRNVIDQVSMTVTGMIAATQTGGDLHQAVVLGVAYMTLLDQKVKTYIESSDEVLATAIADDVSTQWMDNVINADGVTIRQYILSKL